MENSGDPRKLATTLHPMRKRLDGTPHVANVGLKQQLVWLIKDSNTRKMVEDLFAWKGIPINFLKAFIPILLDLQ